MYEVVPLKKARRRYRQVHRSVCSMQCPVCQKSKPRGSPLCDDCKARLSETERRDFDFRLKWKFVAAWCDIVPRMRTELMAAKVAAKKEASGETGSV